MAELPDSGEVSYGGYRFPSHTETTAINVVPQYDAAGRTVVYNAIRISLRAILTGSAIDAATRAVTQVLTRPAMPLVYRGRGYGLYVNVGAVRDVRWGPKPVDATLKPLGGGNAALLTWTVEVNVPDAPSARYTFFPMEFNYSLTFDIDEAGYTTRTYTAYVRIPLTRANGLSRTIDDSADRLLEQIVPPLVPGFRRIPPSRTLSEDKCRLDVTCQDVQMPPNVPPPGAIDASASHTLTSTPGKLFEWTGTIEGTYEIARNGTATAAVARDSFFALCKDRIGQTIQRVSSGQTSELRTAGTGGGTKPVVIPVSFSMAEPEIYGRTKARFSLTYRVVQASLRDMLQASGMWRPTPDGRSWQAWAAPLEPVLNPRGHAGLVFTPNDDRIVDLLQPVPPSLALLGQLNRRGRSAGTIPRDVFPEPTPEGSWLEYTNAVYIETDSGVVEVRTLPTEPREAAGDLYGSSAGRSAAAVAAAAALGTITGTFPADVTANADFYFPPARKPDQQKRGGLAQKQAPQRRARQGGRLYMVGRAVRVRYAIPEPTATRWGEATLTPANRPDRGEGFWSAVVGNALWPVVAARWRLSFLMDTVPAAAAPALPNPLQGGGGADAAALPNLGDVLAGATQLGNAAGGALGG